MRPIDDMSDDEIARLLPGAAGLQDAPQPLVRAAIELWSRQQAAPLKDLAQSAWRVVAAVLSFDSWASTPMALGLRCAGSEVRHLLFSAMGRDIDLRISPQADRYALSGQVFGPDETGVVELCAQAGDAGKQLTTLDPLGEFRLDDVSGGTYRLTLRVGSDEVVLPPIEVGARPG